MRHRGLDIIIASIIGGTAGLMNYPFVVSLLLSFLGCLTAAVIVILADVYFDN